MKNVSIDEIYTKYINGSSVEELSSEYNVSENFIYKGLRNYAKERNIDIKTERRKNKIDMALVYEEYNEGATITELSKKYNCNINIISEALKKYSYQVGKELNIKTGGRKAIKLPEEELLNKYIANDSLRALAKAYGCSYAVLRRNLKEYIGEENWQMYVRSKRGRGEKNREVTLDDMKIVYRRAFAEEIKQIIALKEEKEEEKPKVKSLGRK